MSKPTAILLLSLVFLMIVASANIGPVHAGPTAVLTLENSTGAHVFFKALYPDGFRDIGHYSLEKGNTLFLNLRDLKDAWDSEYEKSGRFSQPLIVLTIVKDGNVAIEGVNIRYDKSIQRATVRPVFKPLKASEAPTQPVQSVGDIQPMAGYYEWLDDSYEWTAPTIVAQVTPDSSTYYDISYTYFRRKNVGFSISVFTDSEWTRLTSYNWVQRDESGKANASVDIGQNYYIWMNFKYRWERWGIHIDGQTFYEEYVYISDFYPSTLTGGTSKPSNSQIPPVDGWVYEGRYVSQGYPAYYQFHLYDLDDTEIAVDALKFIEALKLAGKISAAAAEKASVIGLFISVNFNYENVNAFDFDLYLHSPQGYSHYVWRTETSDGNTVPILYFDVD